MPSDAEILRVFQTAEFKEEAVTSPSVLLSAMGDSLDAPQNPCAVPVMAEVQELQETFIIILSGVAWELKRHIVPTLDDLFIISGPMSLALLYARLLATVVLASALASLLVSVLVTFSLAPSLILATCLFVASTCTPLVLALAVCSCQDKVAPTSSRWLSLAALVLLYPFSPGLTIGFIMGLVALAACFPLAYVILIGTLVVGTFGGAITLQWKTGALLALGGSLPAILPNFIVMYVFVVPSSMFTLFLWAPIVAAQTWLLVFPAWVAVQLFRSDAAQDQLTYISSHVRKVAEGAASRSSVAAVDVALLAKALVTPAATSSCNKK